MSNPASNVAPGSLDTVNQMIARFEERLACFKERVAKLNQKVEQAIAVNTVAQSTQTPAITHGSKVVIKGNQLFKVNQPHKGNEPIQLPSQLTWPQEPQLKQNPDVSPMKQQNKVGVKVNPQAKRPYSKAKVKLKTGSISGWPRQVPGPHNHLQSTLFRPSVKLKTGPITDPDQSRPSNKRKSRPTWFRPAPAPDPEPPLDPDPDPDPDPAPNPSQTKMGLRY